MTTPAQHPDIPDNPDTEDITGHPDIEDIPDTKSDPPPRPKRAPKRHRTRLSLDLSQRDHVNLLELAKWWDMNLHQTITRSIGIARRFHALEHPEDRFAHLLPEDRPKPGYWERHEPDPTPDDPNHELVKVIEVIM